MNSDKYMYSDSSDDDGNVVEEATPTKKISTISSDKDDSERIKAIAYRFLTNGSINRKSVSSDTNLVNKNCYSDEEASNCSSQSIHRRLFVAIKSQDIPAIEQCLSFKIDPMSKIGGMDALSLAASLNPLPDPKIIRLLLCAAIEIRGACSVEDSLASGHLRQSMLQSITKSLSKHIYGQGRRYTNQELSSSIVSEMTHLCLSKGSKLCSMSSEASTSSESNQSDFSLKGSGLSDQLKAACLSGNVEHVKNCIKGFERKGYGKYRDDVVDLDDGSLDEIHSVDFDGKTVLHYAVEGRQLKLISLLLNCGSNPEQRDKSGKTPIHLAAELSEKQALLMLLFKFSMKHGGIINAVEKMTNSDPIQTNHISNSKNEWCSLAHPFLRKELQKMCRLIGRRIYGSGKQLRNEELAESLLEAAQEYATKLRIEKDPLALTISAIYSFKPPNINSSKPKQPKKDGQPSSISTLKKDPRYEHQKTDIESSKSSGDEFMMERGNLADISSFGGSPEQADSSSLSPAISSSTSKPAFAAISSFPETNILESINSDANQILFNSVCNDDFEMVKSALLNGADPFVYSPSQTAFHVVRSRNMLVLLIDFIVEKCYDPFQAASKLACNKFSRFDLQSLTRIMGLSVYAQEQALSFYPSTAGCAKSLTKKRGSGGRRLTNKELAINLCFKRSHASCNILKDDGCSVYSFKKAKCDIEEVKNLSVYN